MTTPAQSAKNSALSPAAQSLGLGAGDALQAQLEDVTRQMSKKSATTDLFNTPLIGTPPSTFSPAVAALLNRAGGGLGS